MFLLHFPKIPYGYLQIDNPLKKFDLDEEEESFKHIPNVFRKVRFSFPNRVFTFRNTLS